MGVVRDTSKQPQHSDRNNTTTTDNNPVSHKIENKN